MASLSEAATITLTWDYSAADEALIQGYRIYYGQASHVGVTDPVDLLTAAPYDQRIELADPTLRSHTVGPLGLGTWYFRVVVYGLINGVLDDSVFSNEAEDRIGFAQVTITSTTVTYP